MRCLSCHYDLRKLAEHRCPECGREFDPSNPATFGIEIKSNRTNWTRILVLAACSYLVTFLLTYRYLLAYDKLRGAQSSQSYLIHNSAVGGLIYIPVGLVLVLITYGVLKLILNWHRKIGEI